MSKYSNFDLIKKLKNVSILCSLLLLVAFSCVSTANAYQLKNYKWPQPSTTFYVDIPGENGLWNDAFEGAMYEWGVNTVFQYYIVSGTYEDPCDATEGKNGVKFSSTDCGDAWGSTTLAVCHTWYIASTSTITQTDIVFNSNEPWNVYSTSWSYNVNDFHRVAVHELGHALGLGHEDSGVSTIMGTYAGDITIPQQDDIDGVAALYGSACTYSISPTSGSFTSSGGSSSVSVTASSSTCAWTASESLSWVSLSPTSGTGSGTVTVSVSANTGSARSGSVTIAGKTYSISQAAPIPGKVTLISPLGTIKNTIPTFTWNEESSATFYYLYIWDENHNEVHKDWYTIADDNLNYDKANCSNGYCTVTLDFELEEGSYEWFIKVYNGYYQGDYSDGMSFTVQSNIQNIYYDDYDGDGYGNPNKSMSASSQP
ncbi:MAG: matrixin family metalloprotease [Bacteriovoracaceae bacterium]|nr:matrixin family metalloprotease [Bacteriovoracaceae bacterium]